MYLSLKFFSKLFKTLGRWNFFFFESQNWRNWRNIFHLVIPNKFLPASYKIKFLLLFSIFKSMELEVYFFAALIESYSSFIWVSFFCYDALRLFFIFLHSPILISRPVFTSNQFTLPYLMVYTLQKGEQLVF